MEPPFPSLIPAFPLTANPNPNPNPNPPTSDLPTTISLLKDLVSLAETTLKSVSSFFSSPSFSNPGFVRCPFDSRHWMPPESLFRHSLRCPSSLGFPLLDLGFLDTLHYPTSLKSEAQLQKENRFVRSLTESDADLCFSLDGELGESFLGSNFFYKDCPGVVTTPEPDASSKTFVLPAILSMECANFIDERDGGTRVLEEGEIKILPSEFWSLRCEVEAWRDFPVSYSYTVLRVASSLDRIEECGLKKWVISNSPQFGILIDVAMRDHLFLLLRLCLKVIRREALNLLKFLLSKNGDLDSKSLSFECPRLIGSITWLASQLSVLYGEVNGKLFSIGMLKESLLQAGSSSVLFKLGQEKGREHGFAQPKSTGNLELEKPSEDCSSGRVFVSQVAAAVAALHERILLDERIKVLRFAQPLPKSQLINEYLYASTRACEIRGKRPNYRAVLEHDGLLWQRVNNQDSGKDKTREELLAEERDYKRRRMSYRGKKVKRNPTEVLRDIIEEHMEEIKQAGGIGCNVKAAADTVVFPLELNSQSEITANIHAYRSSGYDASETRKDSPCYRKPVHGEYNVTSRTRGDVYINDRSSMIHNLQNPQHKLRYEHSERREDHKESKHGREKNYGSRSPTINRNYAHSRERYAHRKEHGDAEAHNTKHGRKHSGDSPRYKDHITRSTLASKSACEIAEEEYGYISESRSINRGRVSVSFRSASVIQDGFEDRYDPSGSYDEYDATYDDFPMGGNYLRSDEHHSPTNDAKYHAERRRHDRATKRRNRDHYKK